MPFKATFIPNNMKHTYVINCFLAFKVDIFIVCDNGTKLYNSYKFTISKYKNLIWLAHIPIIIF